MWQNWNCFHFWTKQSFHLKSSVNINGYHSNLNMLICVTWLNWWRHQGHFKELVRKNELSCIWSMFSAIYRYSITNTGEYVKELPINENRIEKLLLVRFLLLLLFWLIVEKLRILFGPHCNISAYTQDYELKFGIQMNFDTLISNLRSHFQYEIVMTSVWRNIWKVSKMTSFVS